MGDILSTVLSAFSKEPIFVLAIIFFVVSSILKSSKSDKEEQDHNPETTTTGGMTWEEMEQAYGIKMERKIEDASSIGSSTTSSIPVEILPEPSRTAESGQVLGTIQSDYHQEPQVLVKPATAQGDTTYDEPEVIKPKKKVKKSAESTLQERLAAYNRESAAALQMVELAQPEQDHATKVEKKEKKQCQPISVKEGMRWSIILDKPKALQMKSR